MCIYLHVILQADPMKKKAIAKCLATKVLENNEIDEDSAIPLFLASLAPKSLFLVSLMYWNTVLT